MFENLSSEVISRAAQIKLLVMDVDGVLTDGYIIFATTVKKSRHFIR